MSHPPEVRDRALTLYARYRSSRTVAKELGTVDRRTVSRWIQEARKDGRLAEVEAEYHEQLTARRREDIGSASELLMTGLHECVGQFRDNELSPGDRMRAVDVMGRLLQRLEKVEASSKLQATVDDLQLDKAEVETVRRFVLERRERAEATDQELRDGIRVSVVDAVLGRKEWANSTPSAESQARVRAVIGGLSDRVLQAMLRDDEDIRDRVLRALVANAADADALASLRESRSAEQWLARVAGELGP